MDDLVQWLRAQLDADAARAIAAPRGPWSMDSPGSIVDADGSRVIPSVGGALDGRATRWPEGPVVDHVIAWDPARVLREIKAKRQLIERGGPFCTSGCDEPGNEPKNPDTNWTTPLEHHFDCAVYKAAGVLALPYSDRPGFQESWRP